MDLPLRISLPIASALVIFSASTFSFAPDTSLIYQPTQYAALFFVPLVACVVWSKITIATPRHGRAFKEADDTKSSGVLVTVAAILGLLYWGKYLYDSAASFEIRDWLTYVLAIGVILWLLFRVTAPAVHKLTGTFTSLFPCLAVSAVLVAISYPGPFR